MIIFPAIDIVSGRAVRLTQGDYSKQKVYGTDIYAVAQGFADDGATHLHMVDLDGAKTGVARNFDAIGRVAAMKDLFTQVGGGIRSMDTARRYLESGVDRVILGTAAVRDAAFRRCALAEWGGRIAVGVDARCGRVALNGWQEQTDADAMDFCRMLRDEGVRTVIYTDISRDGMLGGANLDAYAALSRISGLSIVASGGITHGDEITALRRMGIYGAIVGKAVYERKISLRRALELAKEGEIRD